jgi:hypothetical protein
MNNAESLKRNYAELQAKYELLLEQKQCESKQYENQIVLQKSTR